MGKIRTKILGNEEEVAQKKKDVARREGKKAKKARAPGGKGGERLPVVGPTEEELAATPATPEPSQPSEQKPEVKKSRKKKFAKKKQSRSYADAVKQIDKDKLYTIDEGISLLKKIKRAKFDETVELHINTTQKGLRGEVNLPHGTGKQIRVVIANDDTVAEIAGGKLNFEVLIAHPSMMSKLARVARILGPKGLMPNPKNGTISDNPEKKAEEFKAGKVSWKTEPEQPIIHAIIGKLSFEDNKLIENYKTLIESINHDKIKNITLKSTMSPGISVDNFS